MNVLLLTLVVIAYFLIGYRFYGNLIDRKLIKPNDETPTAAVEYDDGVDYSPAKTPFLWGHHFASIAGAGPIIGPILAVAWFGWGPPVLWITLGSLFMGAVHDYLSLMLSVRNKGKGIAEIAGAAVGERTKLAFAVLIWLTLVFIITVFAASGAKALAGYPALVLPTFGISIVAVFMGYAVYRLKTNTWVTSLLGVVASYLLIWLGFEFPLAFPDSMSEHAQVIWIITILFFYCGVASVLPVWLLLQPRDFLSSIQLFVGLTLAFIGILFVSPEISAPFNIGSFDLSGSHPVWPILFITVACGAISGFHTMVATGTTSKQLARESSGKIVAFGGMLAEGVLAFVVVITVAAGLTWGRAPEALVGDERLSYFQTALDISWIQAFGTGFGNIVGKVGIPFLGAALSALLGATMVKTFVMTSLDTSTRLGRFVFGETIAKNIPLLRNRIVSTLVLLIPAYILAVSNSYGQIWKMFGASNQLIAAVTLLTVSAYLAGQKRPTAYTLIPSVIMIVTTLGALLWGLCNQAGGYLRPDSRNIMLSVISIVLILLSLLIVADVVCALRAYSKSSKELGTVD